mmetsp:Transcript_8376/g.15799  ORF Transcript_8376/g.15799 Transcript_8376/m.15799 type:complete len:341 (+) Transcript_8376:64-1086(+)
MNYSEDPKTLNLYPEVAFEEDLTPDDIGEEIVEKCHAIQKACKGWGTDEDALIQALGLTTAEERMKIPIKFKEIFDGDDLMTLMRKECGKGDFGLALQYLSLSPMEAECAMIKKASDGFGTNEKLLYSILCGRSNKDMELLKKTYYKMYTDDLVSLVTSEVGGDLKKVLVGCLQAAEEEYDEGFHTEEKAKEDAEAIYESGQGRFGTDETKLVKVIVMAPPKHLKKVNEYYADKYGYTLFKAVEKELGGDSESALLYTLGIKLKPFETIAKFIKSACAGFGTDELLLTCTLIRYQQYLPYVNASHEEQFEKSIQKRVRSECGGDYEKLLLAVVDAVSPEE